MTKRPDSSEAAEYYFTYINQVGDGDIVDILERQSDSAVDFLNGISEDASLYRYDADKWSIREVAGHVNDTERLFVSRALFFARGLELPLPGFDQNAAAIEMGANDRSWSSHVEEFEAVRNATVRFFQGLSDSAWARRGVASGSEVSVRALAYIIAGHATHHLRLIRERYLA